LAEYLQCDAGFETGEGRPEAEMDAVAEAEMVGWVALNVESVRIREMALVPVCRPM
jgi:hypothetical protein